MEFEMGNICCLIKVFAYTKKKEIMVDELVCLDATYRGPILFQRCHGLGGNQQFYYDDKVDPVSGRVHPCVWSY